MENKSYMTITRTNEYHHLVDNTDNVVNDNNSSTSEESSTEIHSTDFYAPLFRVKNTKPIRDTHDTSSFLNFTVWWEHPLGYTKKTFSANPFMKKKAGNSKTEHEKLTTYEYKSFFVDETPENKDFEVIAISDIIPNSIVEIEYDGDTPIMDFGYTTFYVNVPNKFDSKDKHLYDNRFAQLTINKCDLLPSIEFLGLHDFKTLNECEQDSFDIMGLNSNIKSSETSSDIESPSDTENPSATAYSLENPFKKNTIHPTQSDLLKNYISALVLENIQTNDNSIIESLRSLTPLTVYCDDDKNTTQNEVLSNRYVCNSYIDAMGNMNIETTIRVINSVSSDSDGEDTSTDPNGLYICSVENVHFTRTLSLLGNYLKTGDRSVSGVCKLTINQNGDIYYNDTATGAPNLENTIIRISFKMLPSSYTLVTASPDTDSNNGNDTP